MHTTLKPHLSLFLHLFFFFLLFFIIHVSSTPYPPSSFYSSFDTHPAYDYDHDSHHDSHHHHFDSNIDGLSHFHLLTRRRSLQQQSSPHRPPSPPYPHPPSPQWRQFFRLPMLNPANLHPPLGNPDQYNVHVGTQQQRPVDITRQEPLRRSLPPHNLQQATSSINYYSYANNRNVRTFPPVVANQPHQQHHQSNYEDASPNQQHVTTRQSIDNIKQSFPRSLFFSSPRRRALAFSSNANNPPPPSTGQRPPKILSSIDLRTKISDHQLKLTRLRQQLREVAHEKSFLEKTLELKRGQKFIEDGQVQLSQAELVEKEKEIVMYKREAPRTLQKYNELIQKQRELQDTLNRLHIQSEHLASSKQAIMDKIQNLNMEDLVERHARVLPDAMAGALRKSAAALTPFFDYLVIAADTNNRLVDQVGAEIDRFTHVNVTASPFMSGLLFYFVLLVPLLTLVALARALLDSSSRLTIAHGLVIGNAYLAALSIGSAILAQCLDDDPIAHFFARHEAGVIGANLFLAAYYSWHIAMLFLQAALRCNRYNCAHLVASFAVGLHYFLFAWRKIFTDQAPHMFTFNYLVYATLFTVMLYERWLRLSPKQMSDVALFRHIDHFFSGTSPYSTKQSNSLTQNGVNVGNTVNHSLIGNGPSGILSTVGDMARFLFLPSRLNNTSRRYSRRQDRVLVTDSHSTQRRNTARQRNRDRSRDRDRSLDRDRGRGRTRTERTRAPSTSGSESDSDIGGGVDGGEWWDNQNSSRRTSKQRINRQRRRAHTPVSSKTPTYPARAAGSAGANEPLPNGSNPSGGGLLGRLWFRSPAQGTAAPAKGNKRSNAIGATSPQDARNSINSKRLINNVNDCIHSSSSEYDDEDDDRTHTGGRRRSRTDGGNWSSRSLWKWS